MTRPRKAVDTGPSVNPLPYGLWSVVQQQTDQDPHWRNGIQYQPDACGAAGSAQGDCPPPEDASPDYTKPATGGITTVGADPFSVYAWIDCGPVGGHWESSRERAAAALVNGEARAVEEVLWTGLTSTGPDDPVHPHLAADAEVTDASPTGDVLVQPAAEILRSSAAVDAIEAVGLLEGAMASCYGGTPVIHVPRAAVAHLASWGLLVKQGQQLRTVGGSLVAAGSGYPGTGPDGTEPAYPGAWFYATGAITARRTDILFPSRREQALDRGRNHLLLLAERTYVLSWDCCLFAVHAHLGGRLGGLPDSPDSV